MVGHFIENVVPCRTLPGEALNGDITTITWVCLELDDRASHAIIAACRALP
jgi:hypothetical protein